MNAADISALPTPGPILQLHQRDEFERNVLRALVAAGAGGLAAWAARFVLGLELPLAYLAIAATAAVTVRGDKLERAMLYAMSVGLPALPWLVGTAPGWRAPLAAAMAGLVMVRARNPARTGTGAIGVGRAGMGHYAAAAVGTAALAVAGVQVAQVLVARLGQLAAPPPLSLGLAGAVIGLFTALGALAGHLALPADAVEARGAMLLPTLSDEFRPLAQRALSLYRSCGESLALLPREPAREELARTLAKMVTTALDLASEWTGVENQLAIKGRETLEKEAAELEKSAAKARDPIARKQLELAASALKEELVHLAELELKRERVLAKLQAEVALLERARVALIGMRSGHAQLKSAELASLVRKFAALSESQSDEAQIAHEAATAAELALHLEPSAPKAAPPADTAGTAVADTAAPEAMPVPRNEPVH